MLKGKKHIGVECFGAFKKLLII